MNGNTLRDFRKRLGFTQAQFAECISVSANTVARWERGEIGMRRSTEMFIEILMRNTDLTKPVLPNQKKEK